MSQLLSSNFKSIINAHIDNFSSSKSSIGLKFSGKGFLDLSNINNNYDNYGLAFQLSSNSTNFKELAIIDNSNFFYNNNYLSLKIGISEPLISIKSISSNNNYKPININNNIFITSNFIGIGTTNPLSKLDIRGDLILEGVIKKTDGSLFNTTQWSNSLINQNNIYYNQGYIGIGTINPQSLFHLATLSQSTDINIRMTNQNTTHSSNDGFLIGLNSNQNGILWNYENSSILLGTSNQERLRITSNGRIGIGTTNPQSIIDIRGDLTLEGVIKKPDGSIFNSSQWSNSSINQNNIYYNQGYIGIGTTNPQSLIHLIGQQSSNIVIRLTDNITGHNNSNGFIIGINSNQNGLIWNYENKDIIIGTSNQERLRITSNGRIGIGTTNPQTTLDIYGNLNINGILTINNYQFTSNLTININSNIFYYNNNELNISNFTKSNNYPIQNSNTILMNTDFVNINNLIINGNIYKSSNINSSNMIETFWLKSSINSNNIYYNKGNIGIGTTNPQFPLHIIGDINITGNYKTNGINLAISGITFSDERIKTNIIDINDNIALEQILNIKPKLYNYIDKEERGNDLVYGFIAQQIKEVIPEAIKIEKEYIPNIYKPYPYINNQIITYDDLTDKLNINDLIKIKGIDNNYLYANIINITSNLIIIDKEINGNECFIYGKEVSDFHKIDKSYIYTLNVCAIQDLYNMINELQIKILHQDDEINKLLSILEPISNITSNLDNYNI